MNHSQPSSTSCLGVVKTFISMRRSRRTLVSFLIVICITLFLTLQLKINVIFAPDIPWRGQTFAREVNIPDATWTCSDQGLTDAAKESTSEKRSRQCVVQNLCVDRKGAFIRNSQRGATAAPEANLLSAVEEVDSYWKPRVEHSTNTTMRAHYVDETLFVHGLLFPEHFSHWLYNGMLPLYSTMKRFGGTKDSWTLKVNSFYNENINNQGKWEMRHVFETGFELVLQKEEVVTEFQTLPPTDAPICFRQAVIGLGSQCGLPYCAKNVPSNVYHSFRDLVANYYWKTPGTWQQHIKVTQEALTATKEELTGLGRKTSISEVDPTNQKTPLKCLDHVRYYNFEPSTGTNRLQPLKESKSRVGQMNPDSLDPEVNHTQRKLIVAVIQREGSRRILNDQELVDGLAAAGFRVKWITFDHGCGLPETAYLLRDVHVLASPHGNALGFSIFMPTTNPVPTIISLDPSRYSESWFINTATAMGQRFMQTRCGPDRYLDASTQARCPYYKDLKGAQKAMSTRGTTIVLGLSDELARSYKELAARGELTEKAVKEFRRYVERTPSAQRLAEEELDTLIGPQYPDALVKKYDSDTMWSYLEVFWRDVPRYVDAPRIVAFVHELQKDQEREQAEATTAATRGRGRPEHEFQQYLNYVRENRACGVKYCTQVIHRNVASTSRAFGIHSVDDPARWGQAAVDESVFQGLEGGPNWNPESLVPRT